MRNSRRYLLLILAIALLAATILLYQTTEFGRVDAKPAFLEHLNSSGSMVGPDGIQFDAAGNLYAGDAQGIIWRLESGVTPEIYANLRDWVSSRESGSPGEDIRIGGMAFDAEGNLYVAAHGYAGGSILRVSAGSRSVDIWARDAGMASHVLLSGEGGHIWLSDCRRKGRVLRFPVGAGPRTQPDRIIQGLEWPSGLAWDSDGGTLYVAETYSGTICRIDLAVQPPRLTRIANIKGVFGVGTLGGLAFDPRDRTRHFLYVAENLRGLFTVLDLRANPVSVAKRIRLSAMGGRPCPASMTIRNGYLYFTDLWSCSPSRILLGVPQYREYAYRFQVTDLASIY